MQHCSRQGQGNFLQVSNGISDISCECVLLEKQNCTRINGQTMKINKHDMKYMI